ncbi:MAG: LptE family protein [bacterium]
MIRTSIFRALGAMVGLGAALTAGCGPYSFSGSTLPGHIKTVGIPLFENRTDRGDLPTKLAELLVEGFLDDNKLRVQPAEGADSVIEGAIVEYQRVPYTFDASEQVETYRIEIALEVRFVDVKKNAVIWEEQRLAQWDTYNFAGVGGQAPETEEQGIDRVLAKLANDILNRTVQGW